MLTWNYQVNCPSELEAFERVWIAIVEGGATNLREVVGTDKSIRIIEFISDNGEAMTAAMESGAYSASEA